MTSLDCFSFGLNSTNRYGNEADFGMALTEQLAFDFQRASLGGETLRCNSHPEIVQGGGDFRKWILSQALFIVFEHFAVRFQERGEPDAARMGVAPVRELSAAAAD